MLTPTPFPPHHAPHARSTIEAERELFEWIREFVHKQTRYPLDDITRTTRLAREIGLIGREARRFFRAFAQEFELPWETFEPLDFHQHFGSETAIFVEWFAAALLSVPGVIAGLYFHWENWIVMVCGFASFFAIMYGLATWRKERHASSDIVVQDLIDTGLSKQWRAVK